MNKPDKKFAEQMAATREGMEKYRVALSALAGNTVHQDEEFERQLEIARERMKKYKIAYHKLSK